MTLGRGREEGRGKYVEGEKRRGGPTHAHLTASSCNVYSQECCNVTVWYLYSSKRKMTANLAANVDRHLYILMGRNGTNLPIEILTNKSTFPHRTHGRIALRF